MSSRLSDLVAHAIEANTIDGRTDTDAARKTLVASFGDEQIERALSHLATRLIASFVRRQLKEIGNAPARQGELPFRLHAAYALDIDGRRIVNTYDMARIEANRALEIRRLQIEADTASANDLERAIRAADPYWDADPSLTFGQALERAAQETAAA